MSDKHLTENGGLLNKLFLDNLLKDCRFYTRDDMGV